MIESVSRAARVRWALLSRSSSRETSEAAWGAVVNEYPPRKRCRRRPRPASAASRRGSAASTSALPTPRASARRGAGNKQKRFQATVDRQRRVAGVDRGAIIRGWLVHAARLLMVAAGRTRRRRADRK